MSLEITQEEIFFTLRVPVELNEKLVAEAGAEKRSRQSHIIYLLEKHFSRKNESPAFDVSKNGGKETKK
jgi:hypothetical protein